MGKIIVLHGAHGVGKTYTLREAFGIAPETSYTHQSLFRGTADLARAGDLLWLPEWRHRSARHGSLNQELHDYYVDVIQNHSGDIILDSVLRFNQVLRAAPDAVVERLVLDVDPEQHRIQFMQRKKCRASAQSKEDGFADAQRRQAYMMSKWASATRDQVLALVEAYRGTQTF